MLILPKNKFFFLYYGPSYDRPAKVLEFGIFPRPQHLRNSGEMVYRVFLSFQLYSIDFSTLKKKLNPRIRIVLNPAWADDERAVKEWKRTKQWIERRNERYMTWTHSYGVDS